MADITSQDVQRIVNDSTNQIRNSVTDVKQQLDQLVRNADEDYRSRQQLEDISRRIMNMEQQFQQAMSTLQQVTQAVAGNQRADQVTDIMADQINELKTRFQAVERFAKDMSDYMQAERARKEEDEGYRGVSG